MRSWQRDDTGAWVAGINRLGSRLAHPPADAAATHAVDCGQPSLGYTTRTLSVCPRMLSTAANRRSDTLPQLVDRRLVLLWTAANRRSDTLRRSAMPPRDRLWTAANRRSDTL